MAHVEFVKWARLVYRPPALDAPKTHPCPASESPSSCGAFFFWFTGPEPAAPGQAPLLRLDDDLAC